jgi:starch-binding outer membrane protein, SusD/RagB family
MKQVSYIILITLVAGLGSCKKFLNVIPEDSVQEDILYSSEPGFQTHLNGIYLGLTNENSYGAQLTMEMMDVLAQRYNCSGFHRYNDMAAYNYTSPKVIPKIQSAWNGLYKLIGNVNTLLEKADEHSDLFNGVNYDLIKGEGLGLRAFLHFDALRMYGTVYNRDSTGAKRIPYYTAKTTVAGELLTGKEVVEKVIADLIEAEKYLVKDPIIAGGIAGTGPKGDEFGQGRQLRMNYYAVKLLQARVYLYANRPTEALAAAKAVIGKQMWFPFVTTTQVQNSTNPDRIFSSELVFAMQDNSITDKYNKYFLPRLLDSLILAPIQTRLNTAYESSTLDYRNAAQTWSVPSDGSKAYKCFYKYGPTNDTAIRKYSVPLMRVTEAYFIAAEASTVLSDKFAYLNVVRNMRGLTSLTVSTQTTFTSELTKEYVKEFYGEGQLFFYYKRNFTASIANGSAASGSIQMSDDKYVLPLPESEISSRN